MILSNAYVMCEDFVLRKKDIRIEEGKIVEIGDALSGEKINYSDKFILPGFIDTHIHGSYGTRFTDADKNFDEICLFLAKRGITSISATTACCEMEELIEQIINIKNQIGKTKGTKIYGIHLEGPFINLKFKGAMNESCILKPDISKLKALLKAGEGYVKIMSMAPEVEGAEEIIKYALENGVVLSIGHTDATFEEATKAFNMGITQSTHTFNAMRPYNHREPGVIGAALTDSRVKCEMICDYVHIHEKTVELIYKLKGTDNVNMISDSEKMTGLDVTEFEADGFIHYVKDGVIRLENGTIAGSAKTLADGVKNLLVSGIPMEDVSKMASLNPAKTLGVSHETGSIAIGKYADLVVLDKEYNVVASYVNGIEIH